MQKIEDVQVLELDLWFFVIAGPATLFAGISKGGFGSGAAFASASILALVVDPGLALGVMLPLLMLIDLALLRPYWGQWDWRMSRGLLLGGVPGVALGAWFYTIVNDDVLRVLIGVISLAFVAWQLLQTGGQIAKAKRSLPNWVGIVAGMTAGFTSFVSHAGGPPAAVYLLSQGLDKLRYQASSVLVFWLINIAKAVPYTFLGLFTLETARANLVLAPFALLGAWAGVRLHHMVSERVFFTLTYIALTLTGGKLMWDGLT